jgi:hypothetical protein
MTGFIMELKKGNSRSKDILVYLKSDVEEDGGNKQYETSLICT